MAAAGLEARSSAGEAGAWARGGAAREEAAFRAMAEVGTEAVLREGQPAAAAAAVAVAMEMGWARKSSSRSSTGARGTSSR